MIKQLGGFSGFQWLVLIILTLMVVSVFIVGGVLIFTDSQLAHKNTIVVIQPTQTVAVAAKQPTPIQLSNGLGVTRARVQSTFEKLGFTFERVVDVAGQPAILGTSPSGSALIHLTGQSNNLIQAEMIAEVPSDPTLNGIYFATLLETAAPDWKEGNDWLETNVGNISRVKEVRTIHANIQVTLLYREALGVLALSIEMLGSGQLPTLTPKPSTATPHIAIDPTATKNPLPTFTPSAQLVSKFERIVFVSDRNGHRNIYKMGTDGSNPVQLTFDPANDHYPAWSPDGTRIAFPSDRDGDWDIYIMDADGSHVKKMTDNSAYDGPPDWSPDGTKIAFDSNRDQGDADDIYVMNTNGSKIIRLTSNSGHNLAPTWSPDGTQIAFCSDRSGNYEIYTMMVDGASPIKLTDNSANDLYPVWSPDGTRIAFYSNRDGNNEVYVMNADGTHLVRLTNNPAADWDPAWSPDGTKMVFVSDRDSDAEIYMMDANGADLVKLTDNIFNDWVPVWSPR
jgi:Tol biopolymer transport system component